jgi:hypothetical protein
LFAGFVFRALRQIHVRAGQVWQNCSKHDKEKRYKCIVVEFLAMHDFGDGKKGAVFKVKEMGEDGRGSLEPGVASGEEFVIAYPQPFLEYYYFENRSELPPDVRTKIFPDEVAAVEGVARDAAAGYWLRGCWRWRRRAGDSQAADPR